MKFKKQRVKVGDTVRIRFWDHRSNDEDVREYYLHGRVHRISPRSITIDAWALIDPESADRSPDNSCECFNILRKAIVELLVLNCEENVLPV